MTIAHNPQQLADGEDGNRSEDVITAATRRVNEACDMLELDYAATWYMLPIDARTHHAHNLLPSYRQSHTFNGRTLNVMGWQFKHSQPANEMLFADSEGRWLFTLTQYTTDGNAVTLYPDNTMCACPVVPDDSIHAAQLSAHLNAPYTPARHRLEHELWHHLVGIYVYGEQSSPIIWREAHGITHPECADPYYEEWSEIVGNRPMDFSLIGISQISPSHEEWLVAALSHHMHGDTSYDHGVWYYLSEECGVDVNRLLAIGREMLSPL